MDHYMKRQRGRGGRGKPGGGGGGGGGGHHHHNQPNRTLESNGPEIKVRGPASHIYERYLQLARDASSSGDRVMAENYLQHAEHYFRVLRAMQPATPPPQQHPHQNGGDRFGGGEQDFEGDEETAPAEANGAGAPPAEANGENADQPDVDFNAQQPRDEQRGQGDGEFRRGRRGRRNRFRPDGERGGDRAEREPRENEGGGESAEASGGREGGERQERPERRPRRERPENGDQNGGGEGFSNSPRPAFLRSGGGE